MDKLPAREELWRVYLPEWLIVFTSTNYAERGWDDCYAFREQNYAGRVHSADARIITVAGGLELSATSGYPGRWMLQLRLNNLRGEFTSKAIADKLAAELGPDADVVAKFSREERRLTEYGKRRIHVR